MSRTRVCILTAGRGTRMGESRTWLNKALLPLDDRAVLSHVIDRFPATSEFVVGLGHLGEQVRQYLSLMHPDREIRYVDVDPWCGPGSGPGRSLMCCREELPGPFVFVPCDTIPCQDIDPDAPGDWVGVQAVPEEESERYCNFRVLDGRVVGISDKQRSCARTHRAFTGLMRIERTDTFWEALAKADAIAGEHQVSSGLAALGDGLAVREIKSVDVGESELYRAELIRRQGFDFSKPGETLYIDDRRVVKLFADERAARMRRERGKRLIHTAPRMLDTDGGFVAYGYVPGTTLYHGVTPERFESMMNWARESLWRHVDVPRDEFASACDRFYREKSLSRVRSLRARGGLENEPRTVDGQAVATTDELLSGVDWQALAAGGRPVVFHGDLQFDNVLLADDGRFVLLDWRQDFAGRTDAGDLDYDLAKLLGGIRVNYAAVKAGEVSHAVDEIGGALLTLPSTPHADALERALMRECRSMGRDPARIELLTGLIHLNMAPLHAEPFGSAMRDLARLELQASVRARAAA